MCYTYNGDDMNTSYNLYTDDLVGNLFLTLKRNNIETDKVSFELIEEYINILKEELRKKGINLSIHCSRNETNDFLERKNNLYRRCDNYIEYVGDVPVEQLFEMYIGYLPLVVCSVIVSEYVVNTVIEKYNAEKRKVIKRNVVS